MGLSVSAISGVLAVSLVFLRIGPKISSANQCCISLFMA
jgi:hypothetical protein